MTSSNRTINAPRETLGLPLFLTPKEQDAESRFQAFHAANPQVYRELVGRARQLVVNGYRHLGIRMIWEAMRFDAMVRVKHDPKAPKLNDHFPPFYARLIMRSNPDLAGVFETRNADSSSNQTIKGEGVR